MNKQRLSPIDTIELVITMVWLYCEEDQRKSNGIIQRLCIHVKIVEDYLLYLYGKKHK